MSMLDRSLSRRRLSVIGGGITAGAALATLSIPALAQESTPEASPAGDEGAPGMPPLPEGAIPVAQGLWNPAGLTVGEDGTLYIAESGVAGGGDASLPRRRLAGDRTVSTVHGHEPAESAARLARP